MNQEVKLTEQGLQINILSKNVELLTEQVLLLQKNDYIFI